MKGFAAEAEGGGVEGSIKWLQHVQGQDAIVFEYHEKGTLKDGATFDLDALAFVRFKDGKMIYYEEWFDPYAIFESDRVGLASGGKPLSATVYKVGDITSCSELNFCARLVNPQQED